MSRFKGMNQGVIFLYAPAMIVCLLCFYFSYHLLQGNHSLWSYFSNKQHIEQIEQKIANNSAELEVLEEKVAKLRIDTLDPDFLEERARYLLGYMDNDEVMIISKE